VAFRAVIVSICIALSIATFLFARRAAGAFSSPLPTRQLLVTASVVVLWALVIRRFSPRGPVVVATAIIVLFTLALACSYPGERVIDWLIWPTAMLAVVICPPLVHRHEERPKQLRISRQVEETVGTTDVGTGTVLQQLTRVRTADGAETVHGTVVAELTAGERQTTLYVAFCPPFKRLPQVEANVADDSEADVKLSQVLHNGAQFEVRLPEAVDEPKIVKVEFFAADSDAGFTGE
jgi:hypothetical protein